MRELSSGELLAQYRIEGKLGQGGMGVVYLAQDTKLDRKVALKVLAAERASDQQQRLRLSREARAAAAQNHPNIVTVYDAGSDGGVDFIAMEYVPGQSLDRLIPRSGLPAPQLLKYATQIADGLASLHASGILHRDLKPSNIMITTEGRAKILDFGLAKGLEAAAASSEAATVTAITEAGTVVGTTAYMSPEQAQGLALDARSDVFSFGAMLYQMATGRLPFDGDSRLAQLSKIVKEDPPPPGVLAPVSPDLERLILRCLRKDPGRRFQTMADLRVALEDVELDTRRPGRFGWRKAIVPAAGLAAAAALVFLVTQVWRGEPESGRERTIKFTVVPSNLVRGADGQIDTEVSVSSDGKHIAYVEQQGGQLYVRDIDQETARPVPGAKNVYQAFWSPDNRFIGYSSGTACGVRGGCDLMRIPVEGGTPVSIVKLNGPFRRANWSSDGETIVFCDTTGMYTLPAKGGAAARVVAHTHIEHPSFLDLPRARRAVLYQAVEPGQRAHGIYVRVLGEDKFRTVLMSASNNPYPAYSATGHIVYVDGNRDQASIWAVPFSLEKLETTGKPFVVARQGASPVVSRNGTLVYGDVPPDRHQLAWVDRSGARVSLIGEPQRQLRPVLSPAGDRLATVVMEDDPELVVHDLTRGTANRLTADRVRKRMGPWMQGGREIAYAASTAVSNFNVLTIAANGSGAGVERIATAAEEYPLDWSEARKTLLYGVNSRETKSDLWYREVRADGSWGEERIFLRTPYEEAAAGFSPDGRYVVYVSDESGRGEVYVRNFPGADKKWQVSAAGGAAPKWRRDGKEILCVSNGTLMSVSVRSGGEFGHEAPVALFRRGSLTLFNFMLGLFSSAYPQYDVTADGKKIVVLERPDGERPLAIHVAHNWYEEFRGSGKN
ncbi:MAG: protein kinase [Bryobacteraceae bacterium]|nr:protein kinase [Bryobacteraceae bacterium]